MNPKLIVIDGKTYSSVNEMPEEVRRQYEQAMNTLKDQDQNRTPDVFEKIPVAETVLSSMKIIVDGKEVNSIDDLPPDARAKYDKAMAGLDANRNGIPDFVEGMMGTSQQAVPVSTGFETDTTRHAPRKPMPVSPTIEPDKSNGWMLALLGAFLLFLCAAAAVGIWYFFVR